MHILLVNIHVQADQVEAFIEASQANVENSLAEPGVVRFDLVQQANDPTRFVLIEVYRAVEDAGKHKETAHYARWRERVTEMMAEPRQGVVYRNLFPGDEGW